MQRLKWYDNSPITSVRVWRLNLIHFFRLFKRSALVISSVTKKEAYFRIACFSIFSRSTSIYSFVISVNRYIWRHAAKTNRVLSARHNPKKTRHPHDAERALRIRSVELNRRDPDAAPMGFVSAACGVCMKGESAVEAVRCPAPFPGADFILHRSGSHYHRSTGQGQLFPVNNRVGLRPVAACGGGTSDGRVADHRSCRCDPGAVAGGPRTGGSSATSRILPL